MDRLSTALLLLTAVSTLAVAMMALFVPDHSGELRTELHAGDYYVLRYSPTYEDYRVEITEIEESGTLHVKLTRRSVETYVEMSPEKFLQGIHMESREGFVNDRRAVIDTPYGSRMCFLHVRGIDEYWVDSHGIIYVKMVGGLEATLRECSLIRPRLEVD